MDSDAAEERNQHRDIARVWTDPQSFATTLLAALIDEFGTEAFQWAPATIRIEIEETFHVVLPEPNFARLMAGISLLTTDAFFCSVPDFVTLCNALNGDPPGDFDPPDAAEIAWAITEAMLLDPDQDEPFSEDVRAYVGATTDSEGIGQPPDVLKIGLRDAAHTLADPGAVDSPPSLEAQKREEINEVIRTKLRQLFDQLESLDLREGDTAELVGRLRKNLTGS